MSEGASKRARSFDRLRDLPEVFSLADVQVTFGYDARMATLYAHRWARAGMAKRFGGGVYFNLVTDPSGPSTRKPEALDKLLRLPVVIVGGAALSHAGWTTQIHRIYEIAVPVVRGRLSVPKVEGSYFLTPRYVPWFTKIRESIPLEDRDAPGIPVAPPEMALADAILSQREAVCRKRRVYVAPPDEIDPDVFDEAACHRLVESLITLGASGEEAEKLAAPYADIVEPTRPVTYL